MPLNDSDPSSLHLLNEYLGVLCFYSGPSGSEAVVQLHVTVQRVTRHWKDHLGRSNGPTQTALENWLPVPKHWYTPGCLRSHFDWWRDCACICCISLRPSQAPAAQNAEYLTQYVTVTTQISQTKCRGSPRLTSGIRVWYSRAEESTLVCGCRSKMKELTCGGLTLGLDLHFVVAVTQFHVVVFPPPCVTDYNRKMSM